MNNVCAYLTKIVLVGAFLLVVSHVTAQQYSAELDITNVVNDQIEVKVNTPKVEGKNLLYVFPMIVPGTYDLSDYGRFISNFKAYDEKGKNIKVKRNDVNSYKIKKASKVASVSYTVDDTWDDFGKQYIFQPGGVNFEPGKQFVFNNFGLFGYFNGMNNIPYELRITKPADFYGASSLDKSMTTPNLDVFFAENYVELVDQPIMYNKPDTASYSEDGANIGIAVYSPDNSITAAQIKEVIQPITKAASFVLGNIPTDEYWFLFYFFEMTDEVFIKGGGALGALEHKKSSFYFLPQPSGQRMTLESVLDIVKSVAAHEFLHILSPLNLHSEEIAYFDFYKTELSEHLWLYEGVTEYLSIKTRLIGELVSLEDFYAEMGGKIKSSGRYKDISFTEMSKRITEPEFAKSYGNVYEKGALIAMMLDIKIAEASNGNKDLIDLVLELIDEYGIKKPFKDDEIIDVIVSKTSPDVGEFFKKHVIGAEPIPYNDYLNICGLEYVSEAQGDAYSFGPFDIKFETETKLLNLFPTEENEVFDEPVSIKQLNGEDLSFGLVRKFLLNPENDNELVIGHMVDGELKEMKVKPILGKAAKEDVIRAKEVIEPDELVLFKKLFTKGDRN